MKTSDRVFTIPIVLGLTALALLAFGMRPVTPISASVPIDLRVGAVQSVEFRAKYGGQQKIGVQLDQAPAKRLFPCMVDLDILGEDFNARCPHARRATWPIELGIALSSDGIDLSSQIDRSTSEGGGEYGGNESFTWEAAHIPLVRGRMYRLVVRSLRDGTALDVAHPKLIVENDDPAFYEEHALEGFLSLATAAFLAVTGIIWGFVAWRRLRRTSRP